MKTTDKLLYGAIASYFALRTFELFPGWWGFLTLAPACTLGYCIGKMAYMAAAYEDLTTRAEYHRKVKNGRR